MKYACLLKEAIATLHHRRHSAARFFDERNNNNNASPSIKLANHLIACKEYKGE